MSEDGTLSRAFILHVRKFRDTSVIVELLTETDGRVSAVMRGVRSKKSKTASLVRPFTQVLVSWFGRGELKTVKNMDFPIRAANLTGDTLMVGLYVNELLVRLLGKFDPIPEVFDGYGTLLASLEGEGSHEPSLRRFELTLLAALGYGISFDVEAETGEPVHPDWLYRYVAEEGFYRVVDGVRETSSGQPLFQGDALLEIASDNFERPEVAYCAKRVLRTSLSSLLGGRELKSRELFHRVEDVS